MAAVSCPCVFCWPRKAIENEGGQPIFEVNVQVIPNLWNVSQNAQTVHSCASLQSCYLCQLTWWVRHLKNKMHPQNKMPGSDPFYFHFIFIFFYFKRGSCPPILFLYAGRGSFTDNNFQVFWNRKPPHLNIQNHHNGTTRTIPEPFLGSPSRKHPSGRFQKNLLGWDPLRKRWGITHEVVTSSTKWGPPR